MRLKEGIRRGKRVRWRGRARDGESDGGRRLVRDRDADPG